MDDPRAILAEAGVECAEVEAVLGEYTGQIPLYDWFLYDQGGVDELVLALARLVARYKFERGKMAEYAFDLLFEGAEFKHLEPNDAGTYARQQLDAACTRIEKLWEDRP